jgi:hypothetical protein
MDGGALMLEHAVARGRQLLQHQEAQEALIRRQGLPSCAVE